MKTAFFISSVGDTDLALKTITALEKYSQHEVFIISLTNTAHQRAENYQSSLSVTQISLTKMLQLDADAYPDGALAKNQLTLVSDFLTKEKIDYAYLGVPSVQNEIPFQIAQIINIPSVIAYEFMFKPESHSLWKYLPSLRNQLNVHWGIPLASAQEDFPVAKERLHITGHLSIDNAISANSGATTNPKEVRETLRIKQNQSLVFASSTTQPIEIDSEFLTCLLAELPKHPSMQVRLGLHPGIQNLDDYLQAILKIVPHHKVADQFKIILPENLLMRIKKPELTINNPTYETFFLKANLTGAEAALAADRITQAVPGALLNQAVLEGKPTYSHRGKPYLPNQYFSNTLNAFFTATQQPPRTKDDLGLDERTAPEAYASLLKGQ
ncbi:hypothetical protein [Legionella sp. W05-934-2]|uniref:hypothetical protein n=1 Tax=Legionella sp. W05-934-2 TaxID=1198649 RepID=UPI00346233D5